MEAASLPWRPLGELFVGRGLITEAELETALAEQAATGKRLGEILVERGLVSGPDLTDALMDQLGTEISKEEGFGSGLWAEIKRRHKRDRVDDESEDQADERAPRPVLTEAIAEARQPLEEPSAGDDVSEVDQEVEPAEVASVELDFERELEELASDYSPPTESLQAPEPVLAVLPDDAEDQRAELDAAREDLAHLQEMLADAMTALAALTAEAQGVPYEG